MIAATFYDADGRIVQAGRLLDEDECQATVSARAQLSGWVEGTWSGRTHHVADGVVLDRPQTGLSVTHTLAQGEDWSVPDVPSGTRVYVDGEDLGAVDATGLILSFAAPGLWRVNLDPPWPWQPATCEVTVT